MLADVASWCSLLSSLGLISAYVMIFMQQSSMDMIMLRRGVMEELFGGGLVEDFVRGGLVEELSRETKLSALFGIWTMSVAPVVAGGPLLRGG